MRKKQFSMAFRILVVGFAVLALTPSAAAQDTYKQPPKEIQDILNAPVPPQLRISPTREFALLVEPVRYPPIADLAQPMLRLAGVRINPANNGPHNPGRTTNYVLVNLKSGTHKPLTLPPNASLGQPFWSPDGKHFAVTNMTANAVELWVASTSTGVLKKIPGVSLNAALGGACDWMPDNRTLGCTLVPAGRGKPPAAPAAPVGPNVQENYGRPAPAPTFQDLLKDPYDEKLFEYYATSQLALIDTSTGKITPVGKPAIFSSVSPSPNGKYVLVTRVVRPFSYLRPYTSFASETEVWDTAGALVYKVASLPLAEEIPLGGVRTGPRGVGWIPTSDSTLQWVEALDGGDPRKKVPHRDKLMNHTVPTKAMPSEMLRTEHRFAGITYGERPDFAVLRDFNRDKNWVRTWFFNPANPSELRLVWDMSSSERYKNPGIPVFQPLPSGRSAIAQSGDYIFLTGAGATPQGDRPFLRRMNIKTLETEELFRCDDKSYETFVALLFPDGSRFLTRYETVADPPNYFIRSAGSDSRQAVTRLTDPAPQLRGIKKELVKYKRADGVDLSFTLYLPPDYKQGERRPAVFWAYPLEFTGADVAGQVSGSTNRFTLISGYSHLFFLLQGYVVMDDVSIPIVGDPETVNNTYVEQLVSSAKAAIDKAAEMGVIDPNRVGAGGHSYGAFMTANLLAHSDLFRAGIARSGAYNRTLTPFGFQAERRTLWQAAETYIKMSPFMHANKIAEPILLIHGEADNNSGTYPIQSERMYAALKGNGGTVRYVTLPHESHGYSARESVEHVLWEMLNWFDKHVKNPGPRPQRAATEAGKD